MYGVSHELTPLAEEKTKDPYLKALIRLPFDEVIRACKEEIDESFSEFDRQHNKPDKKEAAELSDRIRKHFDLLMHVIVDKECGEAWDQLELEEQKSRLRGVDEKHPLRKRLEEAAQKANRTQFRTALEMAVFFSRHYYELNADAKEAVMKCLLYAWRDAESDKEAHAMMEDIAKHALMSRHELRDAIFRYVLEPRFAVNPSRAKHAFACFARKDVPQRDSICLILASAWIRNQQVPEIAKHMDIKEKIGAEYLFD